MQHSAAVKVTNKGREGKQRGLQIEDFGPGCAATGNWSSRSCNRSQKVELVSERKSDWALEQNIYNCG